MSGGCCGHVRPGVGYLFEAGDMKKLRAIKHMATKHNQRPEKFLDLDRRNDPFYIGSKTQYANAEWAKQLYSILDPGRPIHTRRLHYFALTQPQHRKPKGGIYTNTNADWKFLCCACKFARYLDLLPYDGFVDRRNLFRPVQSYRYAKPDELGSWRELMKQTIEKMCHLHIRYMLSKLLPVHIEVWCEKSTAVDLLEAIAEKYNINIIVSMGEISLTAVWQFVKRVSACNKPARLFYISDFDPAGENMPVSVARKIEFILRQHKLKRKLDIKVKHLMLTPRQCRQFQLPGIPLSEAISQNSSFTKYHGRTTTELHALEVARPGYICESVNNQLNRYLDLSRITRAIKMCDNVMSQLVEQLGEVIEANTDMSAAFGITEKLLAQGGLFDDSEFTRQWMFDSARDYMTQLAAYRLHKLR